MTEIRPTKIVTGVLTFLLCVTLGTSVMAADDPAPGTTITVAGTANTEPISYPGIHELTVQLETDAALTVAGAEAAMSLGYGGTVNLASGAQVTNTQGDASMDTIQGIKMNGDRDGEETGTSRVAMAKGAAVVVDAGGVRRWVSGVYMEDSDCAYVDMDDAQVTVAAESKDVYGIRMGRIEEPNTAQVTMANGSTLDVTGKVPAPSEKGAESSGDAYGVSIDEAAHGVVALTGASTIDVSETATGDLYRAASVGVNISRGGEAEVSLDGKSGVMADVSSEGVGGMAVAAGVQLSRIGMPDTAKISVGGGSKVTAKAEGDLALSVGCVVQESLHGVVNITGGVPLQPPPLPQRIRQGLLSKGPMKVTSLGLKRWLLPLWWGWKVSPRLRSTSVTLK